MKFMPLSHLLTVLILLIPTFGYAGAVLDKTVYCEAVKDWNTDLQFESHFSNGIFSGVRVSSVVDVWQKDFRGAPNIKFDTTVSPSALEKSGDDLLIHFFAGGKKESSPGVIVISVHRPETSKYALRILGYFVGEKRKSEYSLFNAELHDLGIRTGASKVADFKCQVRR